jgi:putative Holliday junction resolvase
VTGTAQAATVLAFDFGTRRIGVAVGNTLLRQAHPLTTIDDERTDVRVAAIAALIAQWQPARLVVGLPTHVDGTPHAMTARARRFSRQLHGRFHLPVDLVDERWTTEVAEDALREAGTSAGKRREVRDRIAAQLILQSWLEDRPDERLSPSRTDP